ncbi:hypothetical protein [Actinomadura sp. 21ATH]|uniref:hypothetical protein n=1 Tax=Actinomadura sp. 21ATH TaxID=1735444 RepID=UPI0035BEBFE2
MIHATTLGHLPALRATSWACTCGAAEIRHYAASTDPGDALDLAGRLAATHRRTAALKESPCSPE